MFGLMYMIGVKQKLQIVAATTFYSIVVNMPPHASIWFDKKHKQICWPQNKF